MSRALPAFGLVLLHAACPAQYEAVLPFQPLPLVDTITDPSEIAEFRRQRAYIGVDGTYNLEGDQGDTRDLVLIRRSDAAWLVHLIPLEDVRWRTIAAPRYSADGRYALVRVTESNFTRGQEVEWANECLVDLERAAMVQLYAHEHDYQWTFDTITEKQIDEVRDFDADVQLRGDELHVVSTCSENGRPVPCEDPGGVYRIGEDALYRVKVYDLASRTMKDPKPGQLAYAASGAMHVAAVAATPALPCYDRTKFYYSESDTLFPRRRTDASGKRPLVQLSDADRTTWLQDERALFDGADLYYFSILSCSGWRGITLLAVNNDDRDLMWMQYDARDKLIGWDTLASQWGDGQFSMEEFVYSSVPGNFVVAQVTEETYRDDVDTMAYLVDTLHYEVSAGYDQNTNADGIHSSRLALYRSPHGIAHWYSQFPVGKEGEQLRRSITELIPPGRHVLLWATGELSHDSWTDYALVLEDESGEVRDMQIIFTSREGPGFRQQLYLPGFIPGRTTGGFHDPIMEQGLSGIAISRDSLVIRLFGGSAWKVEDRMVYVYSPAHKDFYLVRQESRHFHAATVSTLEDDLRYFEEAEQQGRALTPEEVERRAEVRKAEEDFRWKVTTYALGEKPIGR